MGDTTIQWTDRVWNCVRGCTRVSEGCRNCYAETTAARNLPEMRSPTTGKPFAVRTPGGPRWTGKVELIPSKLDEPLRWRKPRRVFVNSMSDLFHEALPDEAIALVWWVMGQCAGLLDRTRYRGHTFQILTKRPARMRDWLRGWCEPAIRQRWIENLYGPGDGERFDWVSGPKYWPNMIPNVWLGVSCEDQATADERIPLLLQTPAAVRFVSYEPALGSVDFERFLAIYDRHGEPSGPRCNPDGSSALGWVIVGGESGPGARPFDLAWARSTVAQCKAAGVPVFVKQLGARPTGANVWGGVGITPPDLRRLRDRKGGDPSEWPEDLRNCREFPA